MDYLSDANLTTLPGNSQKITLKDVGEVIKYCHPCIVVIPGGSELKHLEAAHRFFQNQGLKNGDMSVLFRLDGNFGKPCNDFIRDNHLNNPLSKWTKVAFISGKVPKPLIESKINFSTILNFGISGPHHTLLNYLRNHHFVINYTLKDTDIAEL